MGRGLMKAPLGPAAQRPGDLVAGGQVRSAASSCGRGGEKEEQRRTAQRGPRRGQSPEGTAAGVLPSDLRPPCFPGVLLGSVRLLICRTEAPLGNSAKLWEGDRWKEPDGPPTGP